MICRKGEIGYDFQEIKKFTVFPAVTIAASGDIIKFMFNGHQHADIIRNTIEDSIAIKHRNSAVHFKQLHYGNGSALKITVK